MTAVYPRAPHRCQQLVDAGAFLIYKRLASSKESGVKVLSRREWDGGGVGDGERHDEWRPERGGGCAQAKCFRFSASLLQTNQ